MFIRSAKAVHQKTDADGTVGGKRIAKDQIPQEKARTQNKSHHLRRYLACNTKRNFNVLIFSNRIT